MSGPLDERQTKKKERGFTFFSRNFSRPPTRVLTRKDSGGGGAVVAVVTGDLVSIPRETQAIKIKCSLSKYQSFLLFW